MEYQSDRLIAQVNLKNILHNLNEYKRVINKPKLKYLAVVKANAYGHGAVEVAKYLSPYVDYFAVATPDEAFELRDSKLKQPVLMLGLPLDTDIAKCVEKDITFSVDSLELAKKINLQAENLNKTASIHIALDTGMTRIGFLYYENYIEEIKKISLLKNIEITGVYTHFSDIENENTKYAEKQHQLFNKMCDNLQTSGVNLGIKHMANSIASLVDDYTYDMVRIGIALYGYNESDTKTKQVYLKPTLTLISHVIDIRLIKKGSDVGYSRIYTTQQDEYIATIPGGYADGLSRSISGKDFEVVFEDGTKGTIVGKICMDQCMVRVPKKIELGDKVYIFGYDKASTLKLVQLSSTIVYDTLCSIRRVKRVYIK
ncbi:MAG: alanine racemase [Peptostreptococcaceae bacterium]|nr:alanine racemase [Peptostreptococcaceae bacterium]